MRRPDRAPAGNVPPEGSTSLSGDWPRSTPDRTIHMIGHAHLDAVWLWPWQESYQEARATFASAIARMAEYPDFVFSCDQVVFLSWVEESDPDLFEQIRQREAEGRWVNVGGWWVEPDTNLPMGESFIRQGLHGQRFLASRFGRTATVGMNADTFGHSGAIPQILRGLGLDSYVFLRPGPHESEVGDTLFRWASPDGSEVLAYRIPHEYGSPAGPVDGQTEKSLAARDRAEGDTMVFYGVGNHGGGPTKANIESILRLSRMGSFGRMVMSSPREYFDAVLARGDRDALPLHTGDLLHHAAGCYSAESSIKAGQQRAQLAALNAERWAAIGQHELGLEPDTDGLDRMWKNILFNQFHDILPGSAIEPAYDDARDQLGESVAISKRQVVRVHNMLAARLDIDFIEGTQPVVVFNPHPWPVRSVLPMMHSQPAGTIAVVDAEGVALPAQPTQSLATTSGIHRSAISFAVEVPALGHTLVRLVPGSPAAPVDPVTVDGLTLTNEHLRVTVDERSGWISALVDLRTGTDLLAGTRQDLRTQLCEDRTDTWGHRVRTYAWPGAALPVVRVQVTESGPLRASMRVEREWGATTLSEEISLVAGEDQVRITTELDFRERLAALKLRVPVALTDPVATVGTSFGCTGQPIDGSERPAQGWVDLSGEIDGTDCGLTVVVTAKHGVDVSIDEVTGLPSIGITAARGIPYAWHDPRTLDPDARYPFQDQGRQRFQQLLIPHRGDRRQVRPERRLLELGLAPRAMQESAHPGDRPGTAGHCTVRPDSILVTAVKPAEDGSGDLVVRAIETDGEAAAARIDILGHRIEADFAPYQVQTFRIGSDGEIRGVDLLED